ncbi:MAG: TonB-dependent receptor plug domain-containing protein, partial [Planctomycetota bacterium]
MLLGGVCEMRFLFSLCTYMFLVLPLLGQEIDERDTDEKKTQKEDDQTQNAQEKVNTHFLDDITVTASRYEKSSFESPLAITTVNIQELLERSSRTPAEALRNKPGIWVQKTGHLGGSPILRGFMGNQVIYLFDGIRRNTAGLFAGPNSYLQNIDVLDIDRIEVIRGPGSILYGSDAIGGVINVLTNEEAMFSDEVEFGGRIYSRYASVDEEKSTRFETHISSHDLFFSIGGSLRDINTLEGGRGVGSQYPSGWREHNWDAQIDYLIAPEHRLEFFLQDFRRPAGSRFDKPNWKQKNDRELYGIRYFGKDIGIARDFQITGYSHKQKDFTDERYYDSE